MKNNAVESPTSSKDEGYYRVAVEVVDTHCHLDYLIKEKPLEDILRDCQKSNVTKMITIAVSKDNLDFVDQTCRDYPQIFGTLGIHPHNADETDLSIIESIQQKIAINKKIVAIGEIGLDYYYNKSSPEKQQSVFESFLSLAATVDLPVVIHSRDADSDMEKNLKSFSSKLKRKGVIHSFTSSPKLAEAALAENFFLGFNGIITFKNAQNVREIVEMTPLESILVETDAPYLTPVPYRGRTNFPYLVPYVVRYIAELKKVDEEELLHILNKNVQRLFRL